jgi:hypothetical protein
LKSIGEREILDELRVILYDGAATAYFTFSSQMRPSLHLMRMYGPKNGLTMDEDQQTVIKFAGTRYKSYLHQFVPPWDHARQYASNSLGNIRKFLKADFQTGYGMKVLIQSFYNSIVDGRPVPIPYSEILRTSRIMNEIFSQLDSRKNSPVPAAMGEGLMQYQQ